MMKLVLAALAAVSLVSVASAETVQCPAGISPAICRQNQAIHDQGTNWGPNPVFVGSRDDRGYRGSDPDANVRLSLANKTFDGGGAGASK